MKKSNDIRIGRSVRLIEPTFETHHDDCVPSGRSRIPAGSLRLLGLAAVLVPLKLLGAGASIPFTTLEAESGTLAGGAAASVIASGTVLPAGNTPEKEASGLGLVNLSATGHSVSWINPVANANGIVIRACIPDAPNGGGITGTINLYVNGTFRQAITLSSRQSWCYKGSTTNIDDPNAGGTPFRFYNEDQAFITGAAIPAGATIMLRKDAANTAAYYKIDCVDVENVSAPKTRPANSLSITDAPYDADPTFVNDSLAALRQCVVDARAQGKTVWVPAGRYKIFSLGGGTVNISGVTVEGAGMWHAVFRHELPPGSAYTHHFDLSTNSVLRDLTVDQNALFRGPGGMSDYALLSVNDNWLIERVWVQHGTSWLSGSNGTIRECRITGAWGDGINLNNGNAYSPAKSGVNLTASNNFVRGCDDDNIATFSDSGIGGASPLMDGTRLIDNTSVACFAANGMRVAGGKNVLVEGNLVHSCVVNNGIRVGTYGVSGHPLESATVRGNVVHRSGGMTIFATNSSSNFPDGYTNALVEDNVITDSFRAGMDISGTHQNLLVAGNQISNPRLSGIVVAKGVIGTGAFEENSVTGSNAGGFYNASPANFAATFYNNSWQSDMELDRTGWVLSASRLPSALPKAIDGDITTSWNTYGLQAPGQWFQVDMGSAQAFSQVVMEQGASQNDYPRAFTIQTSNDGVSWNSPVFTGEGTIPVTICSFPQQVARYIRITQTGSAPNSYWSLFEFNVRLSHSVNAGGSAVIAPYQADYGFTGGQAYYVTLPIDRSMVVNPAPEQVYRTERYGNMTYTMPALTPGASYVVRLHFAENYIAGPGQRKFNVAINGTLVLSNFDIFAAAGGKHRANVQEFMATANTAGQIVVQFTNVVNNAKISAIEVLKP